jgi:hypothetical protein
VQGLQEADPATYKLLEVFAYDGAPPGFAVYHPHTPTVFSLSLSRAALVQPSI